MSERDATPRPREAQEGAPMAGAAEELTDLLQRERADFRNYKRRVEQERASDRHIARSAVIERLLPLLDELERALTKVPPDLERHPWVSGVLLSENQLSDALQDLGVERVGEQGEPFSPERHEALFYDRREDLDCPTVSEVFRPGYLLDGRLLRPAQVSVAGPAAANASATGGNAAPERRDEI
jgi:molecular chaperone GrpE